MGNGEWVLGADSCPRGWAGICWSGDEVHGVYAGTITDLVEAAQRERGASLVGIDIPIGLPDSTSRDADGLARAFVGPRGSSVFSTPVRQAWEAGTYSEALAISRQVSGGGLSAQAYALRIKGLEVDAFARRTQLHVVEVHPEASFAKMNRGPLPWAKSKWSGLELRRRLLSDAGLVLPSDLGEVGYRAGADDILDAAAAAWTAMRVLQGSATSLPDPPQVFSDGWPSAIWI